MQNNIIIVGGGIAGLVSALLLSKNTQKKIILIEKDVEVGGLLKKVDYGEYGVFDYGAHNLLETGIKELDELLFSLLPEEEWEILDGHKREISGSYFNKRIQKNSPYIDLRANENYSELVVDFIKNKESKFDNYNNLYEYFLSQYGLKITKILQKIVERLYDDKIEHLDIMASIMTPLSRVILFDNEFMDELNKSNKLRERLAYPEQRLLDLKLSSGKRALYPKYYGMYRIINALVVELKKQNVEIITDTYISDMEIEDNTIQEIILSNNRKITSVFQCIWSVNRSQLLPLLEIKPKKSFDKKNIESIILNVVVSEKLNIDDLYYLYGYSSNSPLFRITAYYNYCQFSKRAKGYPISIEILDYHNEEKNSLEKKVFNELEKMGILSSSNKILFSKMEKLNGGFVHPSKQNSDFFDEVRELIEDKNITNLLNIGIMSEKNLFFQTDVLIDLYNKTRGIQC